MKLLILLLLVVCSFAANTTLYVNTDTGSGTTCSSSSPCASLSVAESQIPGDITIGDSQGIWTIECSGSAADTTPAIISGTTTSATYYIKIVSSSSYRHAGVWSTSKYRLEVAGGNDQVILIGDDYVWLDGIQIGKSSSTADDQGLIKTANLSAGANWLRVSNCLVRGAGGSTYSENGITNSWSSVVLYIWNSIFYNISTKVSGGANGIMIADGTANIYSSVVIGGYRGIRRDAGTVVAKNTYAGGSGGENWYGTITMTNCASADTTANGTDPHNNVALDNDTFLDSTGNYHLAADGLSPLQGHGIDTSGDSAPLNFTTDIDGETRTGTWDIGADQHTATGTVRRKVIIIGGGL